MLYLEATGVFWVGCYLYAICWCYMAAFKEQHFLCWVYVYFLEEQVKLEEVSSYYPLPMDALLFL